jgi:cell division protein FtsZ
MTRIFHADPLPSNTKQTEGHMAFDQTSTPHTKYEELLRQDTKSEAVNDSSTSTTEQLSVNNDVNSHENTSTITEEKPEEQIIQEQKEDLRTPVQTTTHHASNDYSHSQPKPTNHSDKPASKMEYLRPRIAVCGVGGAGCNAINYMMQEKCDGVEYYVINTDPQSLGLSSCTNRIQIGIKTTGGMSTGSDVEKGRAAAEESIDRVLEALGDTHLVFLTLGLGGGTGTGAGPVLARALRERGILTVGVVTKPFDFEGGYKSAVAQRGLAEIKSIVDTLVVIPNQFIFKAFNSSNAQATLVEGFKQANRALFQSVKTITDLVLNPALVNLDFGDLKSVMSMSGTALIGSGEASGERRARRAAELAITNQFIENSSLLTAKGVLIHVTGGPDLTLHQVDEATQVIKNRLSQSSLVIFGSDIDTSFADKIRVSVVATGIEGVNLNK